MLFAFRELLLYARQPTVQRAVAWFVLVVVGILFRFEGAFFAFGAPFVLLLSARPLPWRPFFQR